MAIAQAHYILSGVLRQDYRVGTLNNNHVMTCKAHTLVVVY